MNHPVLSRLVVDRHKYWPAGHFFKTAAPKAKATLHLITASTTIAQAKIAVTTEAFAVPAEYAASKPLRDGKHV